MRAAEQLRKATLAYAALALERPELQRRSEAAGWGVLSVAAHPGMARTELVANGPGLDSASGRLFSLLIRPFLTQSAAAGALPSLFAATSPAAMGGGYYGPAHLFELMGPPTEAKVAARAHDPEVAERLWSVSEALTGVFISSGQSATAPSAVRATSCC